MKRSVQTTEDGWNTLYVPELDETYHSIHGACQESNHVFINAALSQTKLSHITIFEVGFGTGLNAILTYKYAQEHNLSIIYYTIEKYPIIASELEILNFKSLLSADEYEVFLQLHSALWNAPTKINSNFVIHKFHDDLIDFADLPNNIDIVYFDAFAPNKQAKMWSQNVFDSLYSHMNTNGILSTYCAKGEVRRTMQQAGFVVERIPGPPGKREMLRATKL